MFILDIEVKAAEQIVEVILAIPLSPTRPKFDDAGRRLDEGWSPSA